MGLIQIISRDLKKIYSHPYNQQNKLSALFRYIKYLYFKFNKVERTQLNVWGNRTLVWYKDSKQGMWLLFNYIIDWEEYKLIENLSKPDSVIVDVGANVGYYTLWVSKFNYNGKVYAFEPNELNYKRLCENIASNSSDHQIIPVKNAVSNFSGFVSMTSELDTLNHILKVDDASNLETVQVECITLDQFAEKNAIQHIDFLKIDVEGFEWEVLDGAKKMLETSSIGIVQVEINNALDNSGHTSQQLLDLLLANGYALCKYSVEENRLVKIDYEVSRENYFAVSKNLQLELCA